MEFTPPRAAVDARVPAVIPAPEKAAVAADGRGEIRFLEDEISDILLSMCRRGGFSGALVADAMGLSLGDFNCPVEPEAAAACSSVLGDAMERAGRLLGQSKADSISMGVNCVDKVALHRFELAGSPCYLMVVCPRHIDERSEVEVSIERLIEVLSRGESPAAIKKAKEG